MGYYLHLGTDDVAHFIGNDSPFHTSVHHRLDTLVVVVAADAAADNDTAETTVHSRYYYDSGSNQIPYYSHPSYPPHPHRVLALPG